MPLPRPLTRDETTLTRWLLQHGISGAERFLEQLGNAEVIACCPCGCASIDFSIAGRTPENRAMRILSDYQWRDEDGRLFGIFVFERDTLLGGLEVWSIDGTRTPTRLPDIKVLVPLAA